MAFLVLLPAMFCCSGTHRSWRLQLLQLFCISLCDASANVSSSMLVPQVVSKLLMLILPCYKGLGSFAFCFFALMAGSSSHSWVLVEWLLLRLCFVTGHTQCVYKYVLDVSGGFVSSQKRLTFFIY